MRIFAVTQFLDQPAAERAIVRCILADLSGEPVGDRGVVSGCARIGLGGEPPPQRQRGAAKFCKLVEHRGVVAGIDQYRDVIVIFRGSADHRRPADVDVLDAVGEIGAARDGGLERIQIDHQEVDRADLVRAHRLGVRRIAANAEQAAMHRRVQRLDPAVHHFREPGEIADVQHVQSGIAQGLARAAGRNQRDAVAGKGTGEFDHAGFVGNGDEGA